MKEIAERRMFSKNVIDSDIFLDMPVSARLLYYDLGMRADDDGFVNNPKKIMRMIGASDDDMRILEARRFIIPFDTGVIVIRHWRINNYLRSDRYRETLCLQEKNQLAMDDTGQYILVNESGIPGGIPGGIPVVYPGKDSIDKYSIDNNILSILPSNPKDVKDEDSKNPNAKGLECFFDSIWKLYPKKKGKGQVSYAKKLKLYNIGYDAIAKCITRYVNDFSLSGNNEQYMMYGSTFFNSGYVDYLDENFEQGNVFQEEQTDNGRQ